MFKFFLIIMGSFGQPYCIQNYGEFLNDYQIAREHSINNWEKEIKTRWAIKDEYLKRNKSTYLEDWEHRLNQMEKAYELKQREAELRKKGILPPLNDGSIVFQGKRYSSLKILMDTPEYHRYILERRLKDDAEELKRAAEKDKAHRFLAMWDEMSGKERDNYLQSSQIQRNRIFNEFYNKEELYKRIDHENDLKFYSERPYLKGQNEIK